MFDKFSARVDESEKVSDTKIEYPVKIAFINIDSLNDQYDFIKDQTEILEIEGSRIQSNIQNKIKTAENRQAQLQKQAPTMTQQQYEAADQEMQQMQYNLQSYRSAQSQKLQDIQLESQNKIQEQLDSFLIPYKNKYDFIFSFAKGTEMIYGNESYDITSEIIQEMNDAYKADKIETED